MTDEHNDPQSDSLPAAQEGVHPGLTVEARRLPEQGRWVFGVEVEGAFVPLTDAKLGGVDDKIREAKQPGYKQARAEAYRREILGLG